jgi:hypothetical protein
MDNRQKEVLYLMTLSFNLFIYYTIQLNVTLNKLELIYFYYCAIQQN